MHKWGQESVARALRRRRRTVPSRPSICAPVTQVTKCSAGICDNDRHCSQEHQADEGSTMTDLGEIKRDRPCHRPWLLSHAALAVPLILVGIPARAVERVGSVEDVKGEAFAELEADCRTLDSGRPGLIGVAVGAAV